MEKVEIVIKDMRTPRWIRSLAILWSLVFFPICLGIYAGSSAMQWAGFFFGIICMVALAKEGTGEKSFKSVAEARSYLDGVIQRESDRG